MFSTICLGAGMVSGDQALALWIAGTLGGILPDIDSDSSSALDIVFCMVSLFCVFLIIANLHAQYSTLILWGACGLGYLAVNFVLRPLFEATTVHRGIFHSILGGLFFAFSTVDLAFHFGGQPALFSWLLGSFVLIGFLIHLVLDELYSVDLSNTTMKRSFGTALKLFDYRNYFISTLMALAVVGSFAISPTATHFYRTITDIKTFRHIQKSFFPPDIKKFWSLKSS